MSRYNYRFCPSLDVSSEQGFSYFVFSVLFQPYMEYSEKDMMSRTNNQVFSGLVKSQPDLLCSQLLNYWNIFQNA
jgi:hypothetical protein